ncbi:uncharacterized protein LOC123537344 [Mercenaria mercenaria]|uniref:uncharacterized protein LOC123537344 n=1 Tax=Mercenaria mercenaria TaxID=6596 RepID=UPI001E1DA49A|nr:uncharacterized protein LOC123537344 [Mercenaria mercenaria]
MKENEESPPYKLMENIPFQHVSMSMYYKLANKLDPDSSVVGNNWRLLAEKLGYSTENIFVFESQQSQHGRNTIKVLQDYNQKQGSTVNDVFRALEEIDRPDALDELIEGLPEIQKTYRESLKKKHRHRDLIEDDYICSSCDDMPYSGETFPSYAQSHHKAMMSPGNSYGMFSRNQQIPGSSPGKNYQRHKSFDPQCVNSRLPGYEHESPDFKRQRSMPLSDSLMVRGHDSHSQYYREMEPMDHSPSVREDPVPPAVAMMRGMPRYNNQHGLPPMNSTVHSKDSEALFRQPYSQFGRQTERAGLKLEIPSPSDMFNRQRSADFCSPSPTPTTPSTPLGHLQKLANERQFQPEDGYKDLMKLKHDEELLQGKAGHMESPDRMMEFMSQQNSGMVSPGHHGDGQSHMRLSPRTSGPPNTFPLRLKSSSNSSSTSPTGSSQQLTKSASVPSNMKPAEFRKAFRHIKVFVTYAADDKKHTQRVLSLCKCLEKNGFTCCVDIFHRKLPIEERHNWYQNRFDEADFILVVMSPKYRMEADSCEMENDADDSDSVDSDGENDLNVRPYRLHTKNIYRLMYREYVQSGQRCMRFVPLIFPGMTQDIIPAWMLDNYNGLFYYWPKQYKDLLWMLTKPENRVPEHLTPPISRSVQDNESPVTNSSETNVESE